MDAGLATILNSTSPIFTFLLTVFLTQHEPATARKLFGVVAGIVGICLIVGVEALNGLGRDLWAQLAIVAATVSYAAAAIFGRGFKGLDPMMPAAGSLICGAAILLPLSLAVDQPWTLTPSGASVWALLGLSVFSTALAFVIYFRLLATLGSVGTTAQAYLRVPIGVGIAILFLGETLTSTMLAGLLCVIIGVAAMTIPSRNKAGSPGMRVGYRGQFQVRVRRRPNHTNSPSAEARSGKAAGTGTVGESLGPLGVEENATSPIPQLLLFDTSAVSSGAIVDQELEEHHVVSSNGKFAPDRERHRHLGKLGRFRRDRAQKRVVVVPSIDDHNSVVPIPENSSFHKTKPFMPTGLLKS